MRSSILRSVISRDVEGIVVLLDGILGFSSLLVNMYIMDSDASLKNFVLQLMCLLIRMSYENLSVYLFCCLNQKNGYEV